MSHASSGIASASTMEHAGHDMDGTVRETMPMDATTNGHDKPDIVSHKKPAVPRSTWLGLLAEDVSSKAPLAVDGMSPARPGPPTTNCAPCSQPHSIQINQYEKSD